MLTVEFINATLTVQCDVDLYCQILFVWLLLLFFIILIKCTLTCTFNLFMLLFPFILYFAFTIMVSFPLATIIVSVPFLSMSTLQNFSVPPPWSLNNLATKFVVPQTVSETQIARVLQMVTGSFLSIFQCFLSCLFSRFFVIVPDDNPNKKTSVVKITHL